MTYRLHHRVNDSKTQFNHDWTTQRLVHSVIYMTTFMIIWQWFHDSTTSWLNHSMTQRLNCSMLVDSATHWLHDSWPGSLSFLLCYMRCVLPVSHSGPSVSWYLFTSQHLRKISAEPRSVVGPRSVGGAMRRTARLFLEQKKLCCPCCPQPSITNAKQPYSIGTQTCGTSWNSSWQVAAGPSGVIETLKCNSEKRLVQTVTNNCEVWIFW